MCAQGPGAALQELQQAQQAQQQTPSAESDLSRSNVTNLQQAAQGRPVILHVSHPCHG